VYQNDLKAELSKRNTLAQHLPHVIISHLPLNNNDEIFSKFELTASRAWFIEDSNALKVSSTVSS
jgi:hypothetical protein